MAVPLMLGDAVVGILDLQSDAVNGLSGERLPAFEALAGQIAIAIENARLFTETAQARSEVESYLQLMTRQKWADHFDAIQRPEQLSYSYDAAGEVVVPDMTLTTSPDQNRMQVPIVLGNEVVGTIELEADDDRFWTSETLDMVTAVAQQVGQRAENLRLFSEAEHSRFKAEQANRRLTREGWQAYQEHLALPGFVYDGTEVKPLAAGQEEGDSDETVSLPLQVRGEAIGQLVLAGVNNVDEETQVLLTAVSNQLVSPPGKPAPGRTNRKGPGSIPTAVP
ncbi:MAG: GAF domain-containing protein [Chloroflexi bacterium]|nr:GAF domain-containing protein [Chloroflexota bacterium]